MRKSINVPNMKLSPNRGIPGKFMRLSIVKPIPGLDDITKPGLLSKEEFFKKKERI